jgi:hypothetical protein
MAIKDPIQGAVLTAPGALLTVPDVDAEPVLGPITEPLYPANKTKKKKKKKKPDTEPLDPANMPIKQKKENKPEAIVMENNNSRTKKEE